MLEKRLANWTAMPSASQGSHVKDPGPSYFSSDLAAADFIPHWPPSAPRVLVLQWAHQKHLVVSCWLGKDDLHSQCLWWQNARMTLPWTPSPLLSFLGPSVRLWKPRGILGNMPSYRGFHRARTLCTHIDCSVLWFRWTWAWLYCLMSGCESLTLDISMPVVESSESREFRLG